MKKKIKIGFTDNDYFVNRFFFNCAVTLQYHGYNVFYLNPNVQTRYLLKKYNIRYLSTEQKYFPSFSITEKEQQYCEHIAYTKSLRKPFSKKYYCKKTIELYKKLLLQIKQEKPDLLFFWNGEFNCEKYIAEKLKIRSLFFENGYLTNSLQVGSKGVNKDIDYASFDLEKIKKTFFLANEFAKKNFKIVNIANEFSFFKHLFLRLQNVLTPSELLEMLYYDFESFKRWLGLNTSYVKNDSVKLPNKFIFIPFQVYDDTQIIFNSPYIRQMDDILRFFYEDIKRVLPNHAIVVKEHPVDLTRKSYTPLKRQYQDIIWLKKYNFNDLIEKCELVITVNSSSGFQALARNKKVLTLGESFYNSAPNLEYVSKKEDFVSKLKKLYEAEIKVDEVREYIEHFKDYLFLPGGYRSISDSTMSSVIFIVENYLTNSRLTLEGV